MEEGAREEIGFQGLVVIGIGACDKIFFGLLNAIGFDYQYLIICHS